MIEILRALLSSSRVFPCLGDKNSPKDNNSYISNEQLTFRAYLPEFRALVYLIALMEFIDIAYGHGVYGHGGGGGGGGGTD